MWLKWEEVDVNTYSKRPEVASRLKLVYVKLKQNAPRRKNKSDASADLKKWPRDGEQRWCDGSYGSLEHTDAGRKEGGGQRGENMSSVVPQPAESIADMSIM